MKSSFDPFDERHRDKVKRRKPEEVAYDNRCWQERIDNHFKRALSEYAFPDHIESSVLLSFLVYDSESNLDMTVLKRNMKDSLGRLGYEKMINENSKDGRWKTPCGNAFVYSKRGMPKIGKSELKQALAP